MYPKGRIVGAQGLLNYLFGDDDAPNTAEIRVGTDLKRRLVNVARRVAASGGKQMIIGTKDGKEYQLHYRGTLVDWRLGGVPKLRRDRVAWFATVRGTKQYI